MIKRLVDIAFAGVGLIVLSPLLLVLSVLVRLDSAGPVFFRQRRVGKSGLPFAILKFRTMVADAERRGPRVTVGNDARITPIGAFLRRTKLDELPQLWNVLIGDMSLVGPRPEVPEYIALYPEEARALVLSVRPGITDPASLSFIDEAELLATYPDAERAYREVVLPRKLALYCEYVRERTLWADLRTILATLGALFRNRRR